MRLQIAGAALAIGLTFSAVTQAGGVSGSNLGNTCAGCHGVNGASAGTTMPSLGGLSKAYIETAMKQYRDGTRGATVMGRIAKGYNDEQIVAMSKFFAAQPWVSSSDKSDANLAKLGAPIHEKNCEFCHDKNGTNVSDDAPPRIAGQWTAYLQIYLDGVNDPQWKNMHPKKKLFEKVTSKGDIDALLNFYASKK